MRTEVLVILGFNLFSALPYQRESLVTNTGISVQWWSKISRVKSFIDNLVHCPVQKVSVELLLVLCQPDDKLVVIVVVELHDHHERHDVLHQVAIVGNALEVHPGHDVLNCSKLTPLLLDVNTSPNHLIVRSSVCTVWVLSCPYCKMPRQTHFKYPRHISGVEVRVWDKSEQTFHPKWLLTYLLSGS